MPVSQMTITEELSKLRSESSALRKQNARLRNSNALLRQRATALAAEKKAIIQDSCKLCLSQESSWQRDSCAAMNFNSISSRSYTIE
ncbi:MAG: hypothetical protein ACOCXT_03525 [Candidatus Dojkabacteria bacterium]